MKRIILRHIGIGIGLFFGGVVHIGIVSAVPQDGCNCRIIQTNTDIRYGGVCRDDAVAAEGIYVFLPFSDSPTIDDYIEIFVSQASPDCAYNVVERIGADFDRVSCRYPLGRISQEFGSNPIIDADTCRGFNTAIERIGVEVVASSMDPGESNLCREGRDDTWRAHMSCGISLRERDVIAPPIEPESTFTITNNYDPIAFSLPDTSSVRASNAQSLPQLLGRALQFVTGLFGSIALIMMIIGGLTIMFAGGQAERVKQGSKIIVWASIGLISMLLSFVLVSFVLGAIGV
jgi:hypothetical protein